MARLGDIVFDCQHAASLARFWAAALDGYDVAPYDDAELERLRMNGIAGAEDDPTVLVERAGTTPRLWFQRVPEERVVKNRVHLDLFCEDLAAERERLTALGAAAVGTAGPEDRGVLFHDPEGNEFCLFA